MTAAAPGAQAAAVGRRAGDDEAAAGVELFVYYRVPLPQTAAALAAVRDCQRRIRAEHPGVSARLLRRPEPADGHETWMETYRLDGDTGGAAAPPGIDAALQAAIEAHARPLARFIAGPRHVERFTACA